MISSMPVADISRRSWRAVLGAASMAVASLLGIAGASAESARVVTRVGDAYVELTPLSNQELRDLRGGFSIGALDFDFAAWVKVLVNGNVVANTRIFWNGSQFVEEDAGGTVSPPAGVTISPFMQQGPIGLHGLKIDRDGQTKSSFALHSIDVQHTVGAVLNSITGDAGGAFKVEQQITADLTINNFAQLQSGLLANQALANLAKSGVPDSMLSH